MHISPPAAYDHYRSAIADLERDDESEAPAEVLFSVRRPDWYVGFSTEFVKCIADVDKKLQGRILEAISKISLISSRARR